MKATIASILLILLGFPVMGQQSFKTIVPQDYVVVDEAFQVQYVVADAVGTEDFNALPFHRFRVVAGPNIYYGAANPANDYRQSKNFVFTLVPLATGKLVIPGALININGKQVKSNPAFVEVISKEEAAAKRFNKDLRGNDDYFLRPGENVQQKIKQNLFLKVLVDKRNCFVGEPVLAVFKLYSRLESKSDIVKNPGFYGFTVHDMVNLADKQVASEKVNGKLYDVHTIRKVELYPLQAGVFTIDPMEVNNKVEFSKSAVSKKTEQEIIEGVLTDDKPTTKKPDTEEYESDMSTEAVTINVKPVPVKAKPASFDGAVGLFKIHAEAVKNKLSKNEGNVLEITITGKGNFVQLNAPAVHWPAGIEGFEPTEQDSLEKNISPLTGSRTYRYAFTAATPGHYTIPAISFSFFNPDTGSFKTVTTDELKVSIENNKATTNPVTSINKDKAGNNSGYLIAGVALFVLIGTVLFLIKKRNANSANDKLLLQEEKPKRLDVNELLQPATLLMHGADKAFYTSLRQAVCDFFGFHFNLSGSEMNKENIVAKMKERQLDQKLVDEIRAILQQCESGIFTTVDMGGDKPALLLRTKTVLTTIDQSLL